MILYAKGCEYLNIPTSDNSNGDLTVSFDGGDSWHDLEATTSTTARILIAGPEAEDVGSAVVLQLGTFRVFVRYKTTDETIIRRLGDWLRVIVLPE